MLWDLPESANPPARPQDCACLLPYHASLDGIVDTEIEACASMADANVGSVIIAMKRYRLLQESCLVKSVFAPLPGLAAHVEVHICGSASSTICLHATAPLPLQVLQPWQGTAL